MSFEEIAVERMPKRQTQVPFEITVGPALGKYRSDKLEMRLTIRSNMLDDCRFLSNGARVTVKEGKGEHAGLIRIYPDGQSKCFKPGGPNSDHVMIISFPLPACAIPRKTRDVVESFSWGDRYLEVSIPSGIMRASSVPAENQPVPSAAPNVRRPA